MASKSRTILIAKPIKALDDLMSSLYHPSFNLTTPTLNWCASAKPALCYLVWALPPLKETVSLTHSLWSLESLIMSINILSRGRFQNKNSKQSYGWAGRVVSVKLRDRRNSNDLRETGYWNLMRTLL